MATSQTFYDFSMVLPNGGRCSFLGDITENMMSDLASQHRRSYMGKEIVRDILTSRWTLFNQQHQQQPHQLFDNFDHYRRLYHLKITFPSLLQLYRHIRSSFQNPQHVDFTIHACYKLLVDDDLHNVDEKRQLGMS
eukprot:GILJ01034701.1.p1 GENE.GILJ01034701.1~~GILJ01034701.1.p1  ORF type:complete len:155 (+),score=15.14 GILJ01034701.1:58-465(+)